MRWLCVLLCLVPLCDSATVTAAEQDTSRITVRHTEEYVEVETDALVARFRRGRIVGHWRRTAAATFQDPVAEDDPEE